jgi:hypothetical protein
MIITGSWCSEYQGFKSWRKSPLYLFLLSADVWLFQEIAMIVYSTGYNHGYISI